MEYLYTAVHTVDSNLRIFIFHYLLVNLIATDQPMIINAFRSFVRHAPHTKTDNNQDSNLRFERLDGETSVEQVNSVQKRELATVALHSSQHRWKLGNTLNTSLRRRTGWRSRTKREDLPRRCGGGGNGGSGLIGGSALSTPGALQTLRHEDGESKSWGASHPAAAQ